MRKRDSMSEPPVIDTKKALLESISSGDHERALLVIQELSIDEQRRTIDRLSAAQREGLVDVLPPAAAAELIEHLAEAQAIELLEDISAEKAATIVHELSEEMGGDLLRGMETEDSLAILAELSDAGEQAGLQDRLTYGRDTAGGLMDSEILAFRRSSTIADVVRSPRQTAEADD